MRRRGAPRPLVTQRAKQGVTTARAFAVAGAAVAVIVAADVTGRIAYADHLRIQGRNELRSDPIEALRDANRALALNDESLPALYVKSAAYARLDRYLRARAALREAVRMEPHDPFPGPCWAIWRSVRAICGLRDATDRALERTSTPKSPLRIRSLANDPRTAFPE